MDDEKCPLCKVTFDIKTVLTTPLELQCEHEICLRCYVTKSNELLDSPDRIQCLRCKQLFKLRKAD